MNKVYVLIPVADDWMDLVITNDGKKGIRVFKAKEDAEKAIKWDTGLLKIPDNKENNTYYLSPNNCLVAMISERELE